MAAQRQAPSSKVTAIRPHPCPCSASPVATAPSPELQQLYITRADALAWLRSLDQRILALGGVIVTPVDGEVSE